MRYARPNSLGARKCLKRILTVAPANRPIHMGSAMSRNISFCSNDAAIDTSVQRTWLAQRQNDNSNSDERVAIRGMMCEFEAQQLRMQNERLAPYLQKCSEETANLNGRFDQETWAEACRRKSITLSADEKEQSQINEECMLGAPSPATTATPKVAMTPQTKSSMRSLALSPRSSPKRRPTHFNRQLASVIGSRHLKHFQALNESIWDSLTPRRQKGLLAGNQRNQITSAISGAPGRSLSSAGTIRGSRRPCD